MKKKVKQIPKTYAKNQVAYPCIQGSLSSFKSKLPINGSITLLYCGPKPELEIWLQTLRLFWLRKYNNQRKENTKTKLTNFQEHLNTTVY